MPVLDYPISKKDWLQEVSARNGAPAAGEGRPLPGAGAWEPGVQNIIEFQHLGDDWDGLGAKAPSRELIESAIGLAYVLRQKGVNPPHVVVPGVDGAVLFEWQEADGTYTDIEIAQPFFVEAMMIEASKPAKHWTIPTAPGIINIV